jgi:hypothetical protein
MEDATISEKSPTTPLGNAGTLNVGTFGINSGLQDNRALLRFNLAASIPTNAIVTSAALTLRLGKTAPDVTNLWLHLRKVLRAWNEGAVTWTNRLSPPAPWSAPGAASPVDFASAVTQSSLITTKRGPYTFSSNAGMIADVQDWVGNASNNFGWIMISELEGVPSTICEFGSGESGSDAPTLTIQYVLPAMPPTLTTLPPTNGCFRFRFNAESNRNYAVEYCGTLPATNWKVLTNITPLLAPANVIFGDLLTGSNRVYRVRTP